MEEQKLSSSFIDKFIDSTQDLDIKNNLSYYFMTMGITDVNIFIHQFFAKCVEIGIQDSTLCDKFQKYLTLKFSLNPKNQQIKMDTISTIFNNYHKDYPETLMLILNQMKHNQGNTILWKKQFNFDPQSLGFEQHHISNYLKTIIFFSNFNQEYYVKQIYDNVCLQFNQQNFNILQNEQTSGNTGLQTIYNLYYQQIKQVGNNILNYFSEDNDHGKLEKYLKKLEGFGIYQKQEKFDRQEEIKEILGNDYDLLKQYNPNNIIRNLQITKEKNPIIFGLMKLYFENLIKQFTEQQDNQYNDILGQYQKVVFQKQNYSPIPSNNLGIDNWKISFDYFCDDDKSLVNKIKFFCFDALDKIKNQEKKLIVSCQSCNVCIVIDVVKKNNKFFFQLPDKKNKEKKIFQVNIDQLGVEDTIDNFLLIVNYIQIEINYFCHQDKIQLRNKNDIFGKIEIELLQELQSELRTISGELLLGQEYLQIKIFDKIYDIVMLDGKPYHKGQLLLDIYYEVTRDYLHESIVRYYNKNKESLTNEDLKNIEKLTEKKIFLFKINDEMIHFDYQKYLTQFPELKIQKLNQFQSKMERLESIVKIDKESIKNNFMLNLKLNSIQKKFDILTNNQIHKIVEDIQFINIYFYEISGETRNLMVNRLLNLQSNEIICFSQFFKSTNLTSIIGESDESSMNYVSQCIYFYFCNWLLENKVNNNAVPNDPNLNSTIANLIKEHMLIIKNFDNLREQSLLFFDQDLIFYFNKIKNEDIKEKIKKLFDQHNITINKLSNNYQGLRILVQRLSITYEMNEILKFLQNLLISEKYDQLNQIFDDLFSLSLTLLFYFNRESAEQQISIDILKQQVTQFEMKNSSFFLGMFFIIYHILGEIKQKTEKYYNEKQEQFKNISDNQLNLDQLKQLEQETTDLITKSKPIEDDIYSLFLDREEKPVVRINNLPPEFKDPNGFEIRITKQYDQLYVDPEEHRIGLSLNKIQMDEISNCILKTFRTTEQKIEQDDEHGKENELKKQLKTTKILEWNLKLWSMTIGLFDQVNKNINDSDDITIHCFAPFNFVDTKNQELNIILLEKKNTELLCRLINDDNIEFQQSLFIRFVTENTKNTENTGNSFDCSEENKKKIFWFLQKYQFFNVVSRNLKRKNDDLKLFFQKIADKFEQNNITISSRSSFFDQFYDIQPKKKWEDSDYFLILIFMLIKKENQEKATIREFEQFGKKFDDQFLMSTTDKKIKKIVDELNFKSNRSKLDPLVD